MLTSIAFVTGILSGVALLTLSLAGLLISGFRFWPPPDRGSWQYKTFWTLFRFFIVGLIILCVAEFHRNGSPSLAMSVTGWALFALGFGLATLISGRLGWGNAHGEAVDLKTEGWFGVSRNPIYVASVLGMVGLAIAINSTLVSVLLFLWALMYVLAPFTEEPWLLQQYGSAYKEYCKRVPRFIGRVRDV